MKNELYIKGFSISYPFQEEYLSQIKLLQNLKQLDFNCPVTFFVGENGIGKSTLIEALAIAYGFNAEGGTRNMKFASNTSHSTLSENITIKKDMHQALDGFFLRAESFYNVATEIDRLNKIGINGIDTSNAFLYNNYGGKSLHEQSHGESFLSLALNRFKGNSVFIFDEPESALSPSRQLAFLSKIHELVLEHSQFIIATHSPILMAYPNAEIVTLSENGASITPYKETEHYLLTRQFLHSPESFLRHLL